MIKCDSGSGNGGDGDKSMMVSDGGPATGWR